MPKTRKVRHTRRRHRKQRGGDSAWQYMMKTVGDGWTQAKDSLMINPAQNIAAAQSNAIVPVNNPNAQVGDLPKIQNGGKRRRGGRSKKGGYWGSLINQALVPLTLLGVQQTYGKRKTRRTKKY